jgi:ATP-dependent helicase/nuclease subunit B
LIFTPNQRAARELALALFRGIGASMLAPRIKALGNIDEEDSVAAFGPDVLDLDPPLEPARRRGALARLVQAWRLAQGEERLPPRSLLAAADDLCALIDQAGIVGGVDWSKLETLVPESDMAEHWRKAADFLRIITEAWPKHLEEQGASDTQTRRLAAAEAIRTRWAKTPPDHPVIIAGSTGAGAATRILMDAVLKLPKGAVVLPGLDADLGPAQWASVADAASHPQHALLETLKWLNLQPSAVKLWPKSEETSRERARRRLINEALAPAVETRGWNQRLKDLASPGSAHDLVMEGIAGLSLIEAEDESEEALAAALLLRETLETKDKTAALITPEASLARRTAAILERWGLDISASAGVPLPRTRAGSFLLLLMRWALDPAEPVQLLAILKHSCAGMNRTAGGLQELASQLELAALRGPRMDRALADLAVRLDKQRVPHAAQLVRDLDALHAPFAGIFGADTLNGAAAAESVARLAEAIATTPQETGSRIWSGKQGAMASQFLEQLGQLSITMGPVERDAFPDFAEAVAGRMIAPPEMPEHPRIAIWGPLEARLQRRDRVILAGLNEGSWPKPAAADAFLNRKMRKELGLPDPDERVGLSAHDFAQMANAPEVILLRAKRVDDKPAVASRWLWRLRTLAAGGLGGRKESEAALQPKPENNPLLWAHALRRAEKVRTVEAPRPAPPAAARALTNFSPSRTVMLIRDPYADYARRILRLEPLRRAGEEIDALARGSAVHKAVEIFESAENEQPLDDLIVEQLKLAGAAPELIELEKPLWLRAAKAYLRWSALRQPRRAAFATEQTARISFASPAGNVELRATADRVEKLADGTLAIVDFKTGAPKTAPQVERGLEPQLALEAAIAAQQPFGPIGPGQTSELIYFRLSLSAETMKEKNGQPLEFENPVMHVAAAALEGLKTLIAQYSDPAQPYYSKPRVEFAWSVSDYDRLARRAEWTTDEGGEE